MAGKLKIEAEIPEVPDEVAILRTCGAFNQYQAIYTGSLIPEPIAQKLGLTKLSWQRIKHSSEIGHNVSADNLPKVFYGTLRDDSVTPVWQIVPIHLAEAEYHLIVSSPDQQQKRTAQLWGRDEKLRLTYNPRAGWEVPKSRFLPDWGQFINLIKNRLVRRPINTTG